MAETADNNIADTDEGQAKTEEENRVVERVAHLIDNNHDKGIYESV